MSVRNAALVVSLYVIVGLAVVLGSHAWYSFYRQSPSAADGRSANRPSTISNPFASGGATARNTYGPGFMARATERLNQLQETLEQTSALLEQRTALLHKKSQECRALQNDMDETISFVIEVLADETDLSDVVLTDSDSGTARDVKSELEFELEMLQAELRKAEFLDQEQARQLEELQMELVRSEAEIAGLQLVAEQEIDNLLEQKQALAYAAQDALVETGTAAVPSLIELLTDQNAEVRAWAAFVLGEIGLEAQTATAPLKKLLNDPVEGVQEQAREALALIDPLGDR